MGGLLRAPPTPTSGLRGPVTRAFGYGCAASLQDCGLYGFSLYARLTSTTQKAVGRGVGQARPTVAPASQACPHLGQVLSPPCESPCGTPRLGGCPRDASRTSVPYRSRYRAYSLALATTPPLPRPELLWPGSSLGPRGRSKAPGPRVGEQGREGQGQGLHIPRPNRAPCSSNA